jgi:hypothetical protein
MQGRERFARGRQYLHFGNQCTKARMRFRFDKRTNTNSVPEQRQENNDRQRNAEYPKQSASS